MAERLTTPVIAGLILAGGEGRRMGGVDKGLVEWHGQPLVAWVHAALSPVVSPIWISANRSLDQYRQYSPHLVSDPDGLQWQGPMAGLLAGMRAAAGDGADAVMVSPCDTPNVTPGLFQALQDAYLLYPSMAVVGHCGARPHPLHGIYPTSLAPMLEARLKDGDRKVITFVDAIGASAVSIGLESLFDNINRLDR